MLNPSVRRTPLKGRAAMLTTVATLAVLIPLSALRAPGQDTSGKFFGTVLDASSAAIPNATVIVSNPTTRSRDMTTTDAGGLFVFDALPAGADYTVEILKPGFARLTKQNVDLRANQGRSETYSLNVGGLQETIQVTAQGVARRGDISDYPGSVQRIRVGGNVQAAKIINLVRPEYPPQAKAAGIEGSVLLDAVISREGVPLALRVANSQIDPDLAKSAVEAVRQWRYQPVLLNGNPVEVVTMITVNYTLQK